MSRRRFARRLTSTEHTAIYRPAKSLPLDLTSSPDARPILPVPPAAPRLRRDDAYAREMTRAAERLAPVLLGDSDLRKSVSEDADTDDATEELEEAWALDDEERARQSASMVTILCRGCSVGYQNAPASDRAAIEATMYAFGWRKDGDEWTCGDCAQRAAS